MAASFDGTSQYLLIPDHPDFHLVTGYTVALWVQFAAVDLNRPNVLFSKPLGTDIENSWMLATRMPTGRYYLYSTSTGGSRFAYGADAEEGPWTHVAGVWDGTNMTLYVDGAMWDQTSQRDVLFGPDDLLIGAEAEDGSIDLFSHARIDDVRVYDGALSAAEVAAVAREP